MNVKDLGWILKVYSRANDINEEPVMHVANDRSE